MKMNDFRKELKLSLSNGELYDLIYFFGPKLGKLYNSRKITSRYFDTNDFKLYKDSINYDIDKFKFRLRQYSDSKKIYQEVKENTQLGKYKKVKVTEYKSFDEVNSVVYKDLNLFPCLEVEYIRDYYKLENSRITIDKKIKFRNKLNRSSQLINLGFYKNIVEFKILNLDNTEIENTIPYNTINFSKYVHGVQKIYNLN